ncbi:MFS transporter [Curvibacter sp. APW13]|uniref:MFS transporter n=1 Tax=Curvibacter sp. APW13 TaxID=3077236 RepID=UPI0028DE6B45|nr:MFS transporter [Curvibacter sp. APW13]MDT8991936.1 MFS transporter [Curvibacter sp. APW13]
MNLPPHIRSDFFTVTLSVAILGIGWGATLPLTSILLTQRGHGTDAIGWISLVTACGGVVGTLLTPTLAARLGRRSTMLACLVLAILSIAPLDHVDALPLWAVSRFAFGLSMAPFFVLGESWINEIAPDALRGRLVAIYTTTFTLCQVVGPLLADRLIGLQGYAFLVCGLVFALGAPGLLLGHSAAHPATHLAPSDGKQAGAGWLAIARTAPAILVGTAFFAAFDHIALSFLPLFAMDHGMGQSRALAAASIVLAGDACLQYLAGHLADRYGRERVHRACGLLVCAMLPLLPWMVAVPWGWEVFLFVLGGAAGAIYTLSMVASGQLFHGAALVRAASLISLMWNVGASSVPLGTGVAMQWWGSGAMVWLLWGVAVLFVASTLVRAQARP